MESTESKETLVLGLPAVPPSGDPQRLLSYVLQIIPQYTAMELSATHFRLYNQHLESGTEQLKQSLALLNDRLRDEEEKCVFLEKYASEVVKERNELLHQKGKKTHKVWHNCCRKHASYDMDVTPSIVTLRGEKLTEVNLQLRQAQQTLQEKERLLLTAQHVVQTKQIEFDVHMTTCRKEIDQLHNYIAQISGLQTSQERMLYEAQSQLASEVEALNKAHHEIDQLHVRLEDVEGHYNQKSTLLAQKEEQINQLQEALEHAAKVELELQQACQKLAQPGRQAEIEALQSQVEALQTTDTQEMTRKYSRHIQLLQEKMEKQNQTIERLERELHRTQPMTLEEMTDNPTNHLESSWNDSFGSSRNSMSLPPLYTSENLNDSAIVPHSEAQSHDSESVSDNSQVSTHPSIGREAIIERLKQLLLESSQRRDEEITRAQADKDYLMQIRKRMQPHQ